MSTGNPPTIYCYLNIQFDPEISMAGYNFVKDLFLFNKPMETFNNLNRNKNRKMRNIINKIPEAWKIQIAHSIDYFRPVCAGQVINIQSRDVPFKSVNVSQIYNFLITDKTRLPTGILRWREEFDISDADIKHSFTFTRKCSSNIYNQALQYKILTQTLPTNKYLKQYQVQQSDLCSRCSQCQDTVLHSVWECQQLVPYVSKILETLRQKCNFNEDITAKSYIFGLHTNKGLNCILLELKNNLFYNKTQNINLDTFCEHFLKRIRNIIIKEKNISIEKGDYETFYEKWSSFIAIYDFQGPDLQFIL